MQTIFRYRNPKPPNGHLSFMLPEGATILSYVEHWHTDRGWEIGIDVLEDTRKARERRWFFLCNAGDDLSFVGEYADVYFVNKHESKSYVSYLFETTHLSETEREIGKVDPKRYVRRAQPRDEMSSTVRKIDSDRRAVAAARSNGGAS